MTKEGSENWMSIPRQIDGISLNTGVGLGLAVLHQSLESKQKLDTEGIGKDLQKTEVSRLGRAFEKLRDEIQTLISQQSNSSPFPIPQTILNTSHTKSKADIREILNVYLLLTDDPGWKRQLTTKIQEGMTAIKAVDQTLESIRKKLKSTGKYSVWEARISDFEDLASRLKGYLRDSNMTLKAAGGSPIIVVADRIGPAELLDYDRGRLSGLVLVEQSHTSHVAIVARSLNIPVVGGMKNFLNSISEGDSLLVDGNEGRVYIRPVQETIHQFELKSSRKTLRTPKPPSQTTVSLLPRTLDDVSFSLLLNAGLVEDIDHIEMAGVEGVGLYRTEIPFMMRSKLPNVTEQIVLYQEILRRAGNYPVVFRTLDVGGDKVLPYLERLKSENLIVEQRATRVLFDRPILLRYQLRALVRACVGRELTIMLPMIAEVNEVKAARELLDSEMTRERAKGNLTPTSIKLGAMIEIPSLIYQLEELFPYVDFLSVGSNDLFQFFYAIDREYPKLSDQYDVLSSTFLCLLKKIQQECHVANIPVSVCGEMAGRPLEALALIGLGFRTLSMSGASIPFVKRMICSLNYQEIADYMSDICVPAQGSVRQKLRTFAQDHGIQCD